MTLPKGYLPKKGDELLVRAKVAYDVEDHDADVHLIPIGANHKRLVVPLDLVHAIVLRKWKKGDKVRSAEFEGTGVVVAADGPWVWIKEIDGENADSMWTLEANDLEPYETMTEAELMAGVVDNHDSDCATHNEPAYPNGPCDCYGLEPMIVTPPAGLEPKPPSPPVDDIKF